MLILFRPGIVVTVKQRQEFRIRLQKRARRVAERKLEAFEEERQAKTVLSLLSFISADCIHSLASIRKPDISEIRYPSVGRGPAVCGEEYL